MKKLTVLLIAVFAIGGLSLTAGCKSDCEKALATAKDADKDNWGEKDEKKFLNYCEKQNESVQSCLGSASDKKSMRKCKKY